MGAPAVAQEQADVLASRRFESGLAFAREGSHDEALTDFSAVIDLYPNSSVADNALLEIARHYLDVRRDVLRATDVAGQIVNDSRYSQGDSALGAYIVLGRSLLLAARGDDERDTALANFQRGLRLYPDGAAVPEGMYYVAAAYRRLDRLEAALDAYQQVMTAHPRSAWAIRSRLGAGAIRTLQGDPIGAMEELQRVRMEFPERPEAAQALAGTTILYRLHVRRPGATYTVAPTGRRIRRRIVALAVDGSDNLAFATDRGVASTRPELRLPTVARPRGLARDQNGNIAVIARDGLQLAGGRMLTLAVPGDGRQPRALTEIDAAVVLANGEWIIADRDHDAVLRFRGNAYVDGYAPVQARRLAADADDRVAMLDDDEQVFVYADGRQIAQIPTRTSEYRIDNPVDLAFDVLGHLYVLDREGVYVFDHDLDLLNAFPGDTSVSIPFDRATALAVDAYGRLFIADDRDDQIYVLQ